MTITQASVEGVLNRPSWKWETITENDTPEAQLLEGGKYTCTVEGTFGGTSIEFQFSKTGDDYHSLDATNLTFTAAGSYNIIVGRGYIKPVRTGGTGTDVDAFVTAIPEQYA